MSCITQNQQPVKFIVSMGNLPEGFCGTPQELAQAIADRLIIQSDPVYSSFAIGSTAPTSNVGPWLKDCNEWFVWDDATGQYIPIAKSGFNQQAVLLSSGNFTVPEFITKINVQAWGGGGGGLFTGGSFLGGGGGGAWGQTKFTVTPGQVIPYIIGAGGMTGAVPTVGGTTSFLTLSCGGGASGIVSSAVLGGTVTGADFGIQGGTSGHAAAVGTSGFGGSAPRGGSGGSFSQIVGTMVDGVFPGGGGAGGEGPFTGGKGAAGAIIVEY